MSIAFKICNAIGFYIGWFVCVSFGNTPALVFTTAFLAANLLWQRKINTNFTLMYEIFWLLLIVTIGLIIDSILFSTHTLLSLTPLISIKKLILPPVWLLCIWFLFACSLRISLTWLLRKVPLCFLLVAALAPLNYWIGTSITTQIEIQTPYILSFSVISFVWICFLWVTTTLKKCFFEDMFNDL